MNSEFLATVLTISKQQRTAAEQSLLKRCHKDWSELGCIASPELLSDIGWSAPEVYDSILQQLNRPGFAGGSNS